MFTSPKTVIGTDLDARNDHNAFCGVCDKPLHIHKDHNNFDYREFCDRGIDGPTEYYFGLDYYTYRGQVSIIEDYSGNAASIDAIVNGDFTWDYDNSDSYYFDRELEALNAWRDQDPNVTTYAVDYWYKVPSTNNALGNNPGMVVEVARGNYGPTPKGYNPEYLTPNAGVSKSAYVEGIAGYFTETIIDPDITTAYQAKVLNVYNDKMNPNHFLCGSVKIMHNTVTKQLDSVFGPNTVTVTHKTVTAKCMKSGCKLNQTLVLDNPQLDRERMETFTMNVIRHGNNHAAKWFTERNTFYKVHQANCLDVSKCNQHYGTEPHCPVTTDNYSELSATA